MPRRVPGQSEGNALAGQRWRLVLAAVFGYGTVVHAWHLARATGRGPGDGPYPGMPGWLVIFFVSLTVVDPLVAVGLWRRWWRSGATSAAVLVIDAAANGYANYVVITEPGVTAGRVGQGAITVLAVATLLSARTLDQSTRAPRPFRSSREGSDPR